MLRVTAGSRRLVLGALLALALSVVSGCGDTDEEPRGGADLCKRYDEAVATADEFRDLDLAEGKADELRIRADEFDHRLAQLEAVSGGQLNRAVSDLQDKLIDFREAAVDAGPEAREAAQEKLEESFDEVDESWAVLRETFETECS